MITAIGNDEQLIKLAQAACWIRSALQTSPYCDEIAYSTFDILPLRSPGTGVFIMINTSRIPERNAICWLPLFTGAVIARGSPIPSRGSELGLEISVELLSAILGTKLIITYGGGIVLKGFSSLLYPSKREENCAQWHLLTSGETEERISCRELDNCSDRLLMNDFDMSCIHSVRSFVGWCTRAEVMLGIPEANYDHIEYSGASKLSSGAKVSGATVGIQQIGLGQLDFALGKKDGKFHMKRQGSYRRIINAAEKMPIVLYDTFEKRAWLVSAAAVLLHIVHHRYSKQKSSHGEKMLQPPSANPQDLKESVRKALLDNKSSKMFENEKETLQDTITDLWHIFDALIDQNVEKDNEDGISVSMNFRKRLRGWEYMAVVDDHSPFHRKEVKLQGTCNNWPELAREIDALVLFASEFKDIIKPIQNQSNICDSWSRMPKKKDYLGTTVSTIERLYEVAGCKSSREYLTSSKLRWDKGLSLITEPCSNTSARQCDCNRLQSITSSSRGVIKPGNVPLEGALIFGQRNSSVVQQLARLRRKPPSPYSQSSLPIQIDETSIDDSDSDESSQLSGDGTLLAATSTTSATSVATSAFSGALEGPQEQQSAMV